VAPWDEQPPAVLDQLDAGPHQPDAGPRKPPDQPDQPQAGPGLDAAVPDGRAYGIRLSLADVKGISDAEVERIVAGQPYHSLADFWHRARVSRPIAERLVIAGAFDSLYGLGSAVPVRRRGQVTRRDLLLQLAELERWTRGVQRGAPRGFQRVDQGAARDHDEREVPVQLALELGDQPDETVVSGLPEMSSTERVRAELEVLGLDASRHVVDFYAPLLNALRVTRSTDLIRRRSRSELLVAGVKVATQTPPIRSGRRVVFLTLDDSFGPVDATFFEDVQGPYAATVFGSWLLLVRGELRRTGPRGVSLRATGAWELPELWEAWSHGGLTAVHEVMAAERGYTDDAVAGAAASRSTRPVMAAPPSFDTGDLVRLGGSLPSQDRQPAAVARRVLVHASGFRQSPYADVKPPGDDVKDTRAAARKEAPRKLWHSSPGSSGR
jgi:error-prone DNA polymerase